MPCIPRTVAGMDFFCCPNFKSDGRDQSHYVVQLTGTTEIQRIYIYPYFIDTFLETGKSRVYYSNEPDYSPHNWELIMEVSQITPEPKDKLLDRLNKLLIFI